MLFVVTQRVTNYAQAHRTPSNRPGISLVALFASVLPVARWIVWVLGLIFSIIGLSKKPRGFAVAGLIISGVSLLLILLLLGVLAALIAGVASTLA